MGHIRRFILRLVALVRGHRAEADLSREIGAHLQLLEDKYIAHGMTPREAQYAAKREFGGVEQAKELQRDERSFRWLAGWPMDLKLGVRMLIKSPGLTVVAVLALAIAIGGGTAYQEFTRDLLTPTLDAPHADRIVALRVWNSERRAPEPRALADFAVWRGNASSLDTIGAAVPFDRPLLTDDGRTDPARGAEVTAAAFQLLPDTPIMGRTLREEDERADAPPVAVIGRDLWQQRFSGDPNILGRNVRIGAATHAIVGVMPETFGFPVAHNLWTPLKVAATGQRRGAGPAVIMFGRLRDGVSAEAAQAELAGMVRWQTGERADVRPYLAAMRGEMSNAELAVLHGANIIFLMLLGICGANVATLVFARTAMRESEITVRTALGASRGRISAQLFAEALVLSLLAAVAGLLAAGYAARIVKTLFVEGVGAAPFWWDDALSVTAIVYAFALAVLAALIVGIIPALKATGAQLQGRLRQAAAGSSSMKFGGLWTGVIVTQAALTVIFLATMVALAWAGMQRQSGADVTYDRERLLTARVMIEQNADAGAPDGARTTVPPYIQLAERLKAEPGVASVSFTSALPGTIWEQFIYEFQSPDLQVHADAVKKTEQLWAEGARVSANFFDTTGLALVAGRTFTDSEALRNAPVAIVDESFGRMVLAGRSPIGVMVRELPREIGQQPGPWLEIVGVVRDATTMAGKGPEDAAIYRPAMGTSTPRMLLRTHAAAAPLMPRLQLAAMSVHPGLRLAGLRTIAQVSQQEALPGRIFLYAFLVIGAIALLLATAGIHALVSFTLSRRTREIGIRVALGAARMDVLRGVFSRAFFQIGLGVLAGALPALVVMTSVAGDAGAMSAAGSALATAGVCLFVGVVALASCGLPLLAALRVDPMRALRAEA